MKEKINLRLIGNSLEDLSTFSAYLQDSLVKIKDISYLKKNRIFILLLNRFMWEDVERGIFRDYKRIQCIVRFIGILKVISKRMKKSSNLSLKFKKPPTLPGECLYPGLLENQIDELGTPGSPYSSNKIDCSYLVTNMHF